MTLGSPGKSKMAVGETSPRDQPTSMDNRRAIISRICVYQMNGSEKLCEPSRSFCKKKTRPTYMRNRHEKSTLISVPQTLPFCYKIYIHHIFKTSPPTITTHKNFKMHFTKVFRSEGPSLIKFDMLIYVHGTIMTS